MSIESNYQTESVNTVALSPEAAEAFRQMVELAGDNQQILYTPEFQNRFRSILTDRTIEDFLYQWGEPSQLNSNADLPAFPIEDMPPALREMVAGVAEEKQMPVDLAAVIALAAMATALVGRVSINIQGSWVEPVTVYALGLAESGNRKSAAMKQLTSPLYEVQVKIREALEGERKTLAIKKSVAEARIKATRKKAEREGSPEALAALEEAQEEFDAIEVPELPTLIVNDATPEAMALALAANGERLGWFDAEGGGLTTASGARYGNGSSSNIDLLLKAHVGDPVSQKRVGRPDLVLSNPLLSIGILSQSQTLRDLVAVPNSNGRGLVDRFLIAAPPDFLGYRKRTPEEIPAAARDAYTALLTSYAMSLWTAEDTYTLRLSRSGAEVLNRFEDECEVRLRPGGDLKALGGFGGKAVGSAARYAALHHLATYGVQAAFHNEVGSVSAAWGVRVAKWSLQHYRYAVAMAGEVADVLDADKVLTWLKTRPSRTATVAQRDVQRAVHFDKAERAEKALELLADHNWVRIAADRKTGGRPSKKWEVHPSLISEGMDDA